MKIYCYSCKKDTIHTQLPLEGTHQKTSGGCRDIKTDYRTVQCSICKSKGTYDFATEVCHLLPEKKKPKARRVSLPLKWHLIPKRNAIESDLSIIDATLSYENQPEKKKI